MTPHSNDRNTLLESKYDNDETDIGGGDLQSPPTGSVNRRRRGNGAPATPASSTATPVAATSAVSITASVTLMAATPQSSSQGALTPSSFLEKQPDDHDVDDEFLALAKATAFGLRRETRRSWHASLTVAQRRVRVLLFSLHNSKMIVCLF